MLACLSGILRDAADDEARREAWGRAVVVFFTTVERGPCEALRRSSSASLGSTDGLWIAWPKKASKLDTDLDFESVQQIGLDAGLVDNKSASIDDDWQGLRLRLPAQRPLVACRRVGGARPALVVSSDPVGLDAAGLGERRA